MLGHFAVQMVGCLARLIFYFYNYQFYWKLKKSKPNLNHLIIIFSLTHLGVTPSSPSWANNIFWSICRSFYHWNKKSGGLGLWPILKKFSIDIYKIWLIIKKINMARRSSEYIFKFGYEVGVIWAWVGVISLLTPISPIYAHFTSI